MKTLFLSFLLIFGLFEMGYTANPSPRTIFGFIEGTCSRALRNIMRPISPWAKVESGIAKKFDQHGHKVGSIRGFVDLNKDVYHKGLLNLALALETETPLSPYSRMVTSIVITAHGREVHVGDSSFFGGLSVYISAYTPVEEIMPKMSIDLLEHEIEQKRHQYGPTSFRFDKHSGVDDKRLASFLEKTFLKALEDENDAARIADFPDHVWLRIVDEKSLNAGFRSAVYSGFEIFVSADAPAESLFHRLANVLLEKQVTDWMWEQYAYRGRFSGSAVINDGVDDAAYERGLKLVLEWFDNPSLVRETEHILVRLGRIYVTENQLEIRPRASFDRGNVFDIYIPSDGAEMNAEMFTKLLPPAE